MPIQKHLVVHQLYLHYLEYQTCYQLILSSYPKPPSYTVQAGHSSVRVLFSCCLVLGVGQESNLRPLVLETNALPIELPTHLVTKGGIEPPHKLHELILYRCTSVSTSIPSLAHCCTGCDPIQVLCHLLQSIILAFNFSSASLRVMVGRSGRT